MALLRHLYHNQLVPTVPKRQQAPTIARSPFLSVYWMILPPVIPARVSEVLREVKVPGNTTYPASVSHEKNAARMLSQVGAWFAWVDLAM